MAQLFRSGLGLQYTGFLGPAFRRDLPISTWALQAHGRFCRNASRRSIISAWTNSNFFRMSSKSLQARPAIHFTGSTLVWSMGAAAIRNQMQATGKKSVDINYWYGGLPSTIEVRYFLFHSEHIRAFAFQEVRPPFLATGPSSSSWAALD